MHHTHTSALKRKGVFPQTRSLKPRLSTSTPSRTNLLTLPDESLSHIFSLLLSAEHLTPRARSTAALALARSHTRLFRVFARCVTRVSTDEDFHADYVFLPRLRFLRHVLENGASALRRLHLDELHCGLLKHLHHCCPRLHAFSVARPHDCDACCETLKSMLTPYLRSLAITVSSKRILSAIETPPPELALLMTATFPEEMEHLTGFRFDKLTIHFIFRPFKKNQVDRLVRYTMPHLRELCARTTQLSVTLSHSKCMPTPPGNLTFHEALRRFDRVRTNHDNFLCTSIKLSGTCLFPLLQRVNPHAAIELSAGNVTIVQEGANFYAKKLPLSSSLPLTLTNVARLEQVVIQRKCNPRWADLLSGRRISRALVSNLRIAAVLKLHIDKLFIEACDIQGTNWRWLSRVREVHILMPSRPKPLQLRSLLAALPHMIDNFNGFLCWVHELEMYKYIVPVQNGSDDDDDVHVHGHDHQYRQDDTDYRDYRNESRHDRRRRIRPSSYQLAGDFIDSLERRLIIGNSVIRELALGLSASYSALNKFEQRGGDGQTLRAMLENIRRFMFTEFGKEVHIVEFT